MTNEIEFQVDPDEEGGYVARAELDKGFIITQGDTLAELKTMIKDAIYGCFFDKPAERPHLVRLHTDEVFVTV